MIQTEMKAFEGQINLTLLDSIISFAVHAAGATRQQKCQLRRRCIFPNQNMGSSHVQENYGFLYLGELLERYEERFGMPVQDLRAIALALGYTKDVVTDTMFVGSQRADFIQKVRRNAQDDVYLTGALYLLNEGRSDGLAYESQLKERQYTRTEELVFVMSLFRDIEAAFVQFKPQLLTLLGKDRTLPVLENTQIFQWIAAALFPLKKQMRGKDTTLVRALLALPVSFVKDGGKPYDCLRTYGYSPVEIAYANAMAVYDHWVDGGIRSNSLIAEKIAVELFRAVLNCDAALPEAIYERLTGVYSRYAEFEIKCYGVRKLSDALKCGVRIQAPETMAWFIERDSVWHPAVGSFDILDPKWDPLAVNLKPDTYHSLFESSLDETMDAEELRQRIDRYDALTQKSYLDCYWNGREGRCFSLLVQTGIIDLWTAFQASIGTDGTATKPTMMKCIGSYVRGIDTVRAFQFFKEFMPRYGYAGLKKFFSGFSDGFFGQLWRGGRYSSDSKISLTLQRDYLKDDPAGQLLLLHWVEEYFFSVAPKDYLSLVQAVLEHEDVARLLPQEDQRRLFDLFVSQKGLPLYIVNSLKRHYLTPEEQLADQVARDAEKREEQRQREIAMVQSIQTRYKSSTDISFESVLKFMNEYQYYDEKYNAAAQIVHEGLEERLQNVGESLSRKDAAYFLRVCAELVKLDTMSWAEAQACIMRIKEVVDDDPSGDPTG